MNRSFSLLLLITLLTGCQKTYEHSEPASPALEERMHRDMDRIEGNSEVLRQNEDKRF